MEFYSFIKVVISGFILSSTYFVLKAYENILKTDKRAGESRPFLSRELFDHLNQIR